MADQVTVDEVGRNETMQPPDCWAAMRTADLGRLAFSADGRPEIFPINYVVDGGTVVFRTAAQSTIASALDGRPVAFEVDGHTNGRAWSVIVRGEARAVVGLYDSLAAATLPLHPQHPGPKDALARITPREITGRRFTVADAHSWDTPVGSAPRAAHE